MCPVRLVSSVHEFEIDINNDFFLQRPAEIIFLQQPPGFS